MSLSLFFLLFSLFSFLLYLLFHLRPCTTRERAINLSILAMSHPGEFSSVESNQATSSTPCGPDFHVQRFICADWI